MTPSDAALVRLSAALAAGDPGRLEDPLRRAAAEAPAEAVEEVILQSYLFLGFPASLNAFSLWREISDRPAPEPGREDPGDWAIRGEEVCRAVYGGQYERLRANVRRLHPDLERWMVVEGYGKVLGRPGLPLVTRELCVSALLAVLGVARQLHSHLRGALNVGATPEAVEEVLALAQPFMDGGRARDARRVWQAVRARMP